MPEIALKALKSHFRSVEDGRAKFAPVYLLHGNEYLYKQGLAALLDRLLPPEERTMRCTTYEGSGAGLQQALNELNTFALIPGSKVAVIAESRVFYSRKNKTALLEKARRGAEGGRYRSAATPFVAYLQLTGWTLDDVIPGGPSANELRRQWGTEKEGVLEKLIDYCRSKSLGTGTDSGGADRLAAALSKGFPERHHLVLTTEVIDKRRKLYKQLKSIGIIVDCGVPKGNRFADRQAQEQVLREQVQRILEPHHKTLAPQAFAYICEITGFDLRTFSQNLEKLAAYVGDRPRIEPEDARRVLARSRSDPIFELTNALFLRDADNALFFLRNMFEQEIQPLQILGAIVNQLRKLMRAREFITTVAGRAWVPEMPFARFKSGVMPLLLAYDQSLVQLLDEWSQTLQQNTENLQGRKRAKKGPTLQSDLVLAKSPQSAYPVYQLLLKADKYSTTDLLAALDKAQQADRRLKGSRLSPALILEELIIDICRPGPSPIA
ncbi:MAG: hypothetical protein QNJ22_23745 [Desulfosarcinaceae bacterium]|nr:hypothetical protein [Desulfosarcinaceae bacterium]